MRALLWAAAFLLSALPADAAGARTGRLIIKLKNRAETRALTLPSNRVNALSSSAGLTLRHQRAMSGDKQVMALPGTVDLAEAEDIARRLRQDPAVEFAEPDIRLFPSLTPNDPSFSSQWHYTSSASNTGGVNLPGAWNVTTGTPTVIVAVIDSGITPHSDLDGQRVAGYDMIAADPGSTCSFSYCTAADGDGRDSDPNDPGDFLTSTEISAEDAFTGCPVSNTSSWHGTHVAGTIGAASDNGSGVAGVAWNVKIQPVRALGKCGGYLSDIADSIIWAAGGSVPGVPSNSTPASVINMSLSGFSSSCPQTYSDAISVAVNAGIPVVVAAGNDADSANTYSPANCTSAITVAALNRNGGKAFYSNTGSAVDLAAPGGDTSGGSGNGVLSTYNAGAQTQGSETTAFLQGTSMAAPHVAGVLALLRSIEPGLTPAQLLSKLQATARSFPDSSCNTSICGSGMLDAEKAVLATLTLPTVSGVTAATLGVSSISYSWTPGGAAAGSFRIRDDSNGSLLVTTASAPGVVTGLGPNAALTARVAGVRLTIEGTPALSISTRTLGTAPGSPSGVPHLSSVTVSWTVCPVGECAGYSIDLSTAPNMTGVLSNAKTNNRAVSSLDVTGLLSGTSYWARVSSLNDLGGLNPVYFGPVYTNTNLLAPNSVAAAGTGPTTLDVTWANPGNPGGTLYDAQVSSVSDHSTGVALITNIGGLTAGFTGLQANTTYYPRVKTVGGPDAVGPEASTLAGDPLPSGVEALDEASVSLEWAPGSNAPVPHTVYLAEVASDSGFSSIAGSSHTRSLSADFTGLSVNTTYYGRVRVIPNAGAARPSVLLDPEPTLAAVPTAVSASAADQNTIDVTLGAAGNPAGTRYRVELAADPAFAGAVSSVTLSTTARFTGLTPATSYYARIRALNHAGALSAPSATLIAVTNPAIPAFAATLKTTASVSSLTLRWDANGGGGALPYRAELHDQEDFGGASIASVTYNTQASFTGLSSNTTYWLRVKRHGVSAPTDTPFASLGWASTLALPAGAPASPFDPIAYTSSVVRWVARPAAPVSSSAQGYKVDFATSANFGGLVLSSTVWGSASSTAGVTALKANTTYWVRVGSLNHEAEPSWLVLGSTRTLLPLFSSAVVQGAPVALSVIPSFPEFSSIRVDVPAGAFPPGTAVTVNASVGSELPGVTAADGPITPLAPGVGLSIDAGGMQPSRNIVVKMSYDPLSLDPSVNPKNLRLYRYDETWRKWALLPGSVDTEARTLTALTNHFSLFAPFIVAAGTAVDQTQIFPIPWAPGSGEGDFNSPALTFASLPAEAEVRLLTLSGEQLWARRADSSGIVTWDGITRHGRRAGSGTYLAVIEKDGSRVVRRVVVVR